jgi:hypothetical protein
MIISGMAASMQVTSAARRSRRCAARWETASRSPRPRRPGSSDGWALPCRPRRRCRVAVVGRRWPPGVCTVTSMRERVLTLKTRTVVSPSAAGTRPCSMAKGRHARQHVAAVRPGVDGLLPHAHLGEQVVHVAVGLAAARHDGHLAGQRAAAAHAVHLQQVGRRWRRSAPGHASASSAGSQLAQEERAARGAGAHQHAGKGERFMAR